MSDGEWLDRTVPVSVAQPLLPIRPGKYAFFVDDLVNLPSLFSLAAQSRLRPKLLYIGKADVSLAQRVWHEECQHRRPGTFFRSIGAMLGYTSPLGGRNYEFTAADKQAVIAWIAEHLLVSWDDRPLAGSHKASEGVLIARFTPLLNLQGNPQKLPELARLRAICRAGQT